MKRTLILLALAAGMGIGASAPVLAQRTIIAVAEDFAVVCGLAMTDVDAAAKQAERMGFGQIVKAEPNNASTAVAVNGPRGNFVFTLLTFSDMSHLTCTHTVLAALTIADIEEVAMRFRQVRGVGTLEGGVGSPAGPINPHNMIFGTYKRPGNDPVITLNTLTTAQLSNIAVSVIRLTSKN
jgi:hypothetical protein